VSYDLKKGICVYAVGVQMPTVIRSGDGNRMVQGRRWLMSSAIGLYRQARGARAQSQTDRHGVGRLAQITSSSGSVLVPLKAKPPLWSRGRDVCGQAACEPGVGGCGGVPVHPARIHTHRTSPAQALLTSLTETC
jgi:hypothetical protein